MSEDRSRYTASGQEVELDLYSIWRDVSRQWLSILLIPVSTLAIAYVLLMLFHPLGYATTATMVVTNVQENESSVTTSGSDVYDTLYYATASAESLTSILSSDSLRNKVAKDLGIEEFVGDASAQTLGDSNLVEITVTTNSPRLSYLEMQSILANYEDFSGDLLGGTELTVLEDPKVADAPASPHQNLKYAVLIAVLVFVLLVALLAVRSIMLDTVHNSKEVESKLDTKLLATVYHEEKRKLVGQKISVLITDPATSFRYVETMKKLGSRIINEMKGKNEKILLVSSAMENEGKSTVAANIALALSQSGQKVLLIDMDFRKPSLYKVLNMQQEKYESLHKVFENKGTIRTGDFICEVPGTGLHCILNNTAAPQATERHAGLLRALLRRYASQFDFVILDTAPISLASDTEELAFVADTSVIVVRQHMVEAGEINDAIDALGGKRRVLGCVFNDAHESGFGVTGSSYGYGGHYGSYGYGYGYGYGSASKKKGTNAGK